MPEIEKQRRACYFCNCIKDNIKLIEDMLFCFTSQKVINKLIAERDELEELLGLYRNLRIS